MTGAWRRRWHEAGFPPGRTSLRYSSRGAERLGPATQSACGRMNAAPHRTSGRQTRLVRRMVPGAALNAWAAIGLCFATGCGAKARSVDAARGEIHAAPASADRAAAPDCPNGNPTAYLKVVLERTASLNAYSCMFLRQERLGLFPSLQKPEIMRALYRSVPLSVRFDWQDADSDIAAVSYVAGRDGDRVSLLRRTGWLGMKPAVEHLDPMLSVAFGKSRFPITEFGLRRLLEMTLQRMRNAESCGGARVAYRGRTTLAGRDSHLIEITFPDADPYPNKRQDLYVDARTDLPIGADLWLADGALDARYRYSQIQPLTTAPDDDAFCIRTDDAGMSSDPVHATAIGR